MCPSQGVIFQMLAQRFENAVPAMGWKGGGADVGTNLIDGHESAQRRIAARFGADVGTNLIDGHRYVSFNSERNQGADVGTNLIDGHGLN